MPSRPNWYDNEPQVRHPPTCSCPSCQRWRYRPRPARRSSLPKLLIGSAILGIIILAVSACAGEGQNSATDSARGATADVGEGTKSVASEEGAAEAGGPTQQGKLTFVTPTPTPAGKYDLIETELRMLGVFHNFRGYGANWDDEQLLQTVVRCGGPKEIVDGLVQGVIPSEFLYQHEPRKRVLSTGRDEAWSTWSYAKAGVDRFQRAVTIGLHGTPSGGIQWRLLIADVWGEGRDAADGTISDGCEVLTKSLEAIW